MMSREVQPTRPVLPLSAAPLCAFAEFTFFPEGYITPEARFCKNAGGVEWGGERARRRAIDFSRAQRATPNETLSSRPVCFALDARFVILWHAEVPAPIIHTCLA